MGTHLKSDTFLNLNLALRTKKARTALDHLVDQIINDFHITLREKQKRVLCLIALNYIANDFGGLIISRNNNSHKIGGGRYNRAEIGSAVLISTLECLIVQNIIKTRYNALPNANGNEASVYCPTEAFEKLCRRKMTAIKSALRDDRELIELNLKEKIQIVVAKPTKRLTQLDYYDTAFTNEARKFLRKYNAWLEEAIIDFTDYPRLTESQTGSLRIVHRNRTLVRKFVAPKRCDRHSHENFPKEPERLGGRLYHGFWQEVHSACRPYITIDNQQTVEIDFRAMNAQMLYLLTTGRPCTYYPYERVPLPNNLSETFPKDFIKAVMVWGINCATRKQMTSALCYKLPVELKKQIKNGNLDAKCLTLLKDEGISYAQLLDATLAAHPQIASHFPAKGVTKEIPVGLRLQYDDSQIAEKILRQCLKDGVYALPIHDSFIVQAKYESYLANLMIKTLLNHFKYQANECPDKDLLVKVIKGVEPD